MVVPAAGDCTMYGRKVLLSSHMWCSCWRFGRLFPGCQLYANSVSKQLFSDILVTGCWCLRPVDHHTRTLTSCTLLVRVAHISIILADAVKLRLICSVLDLEIPRLYSLSKCLPHFFSTLVGEYPPQQRMRTGNVNTFQTFPSTRSNFSSYNLKTCSLR